MTTQALLHELLLALLGHTGQCIQPVLTAVPSNSVPSDANDDAAAAAVAEPSFEVTGLALSPSVPLVTPAERAAIDGLLVAGFAYVRIMHFVQNIDGGASTAAATAAAAGSRATHTRNDSYSQQSTPNGAAAAANVAASPTGIAAAALHTKVASSAAEQRALDAQAARHVYSAAGLMLSPPKPPRGGTASYDRSDAPPFNLDSQATTTTALVPMQHPLLEARGARPEPKAVGLYLRALGVGLEEVLGGYRSLILHIEQEILSEIACDPSSAPQNQQDTDDDTSGQQNKHPAPAVHRIEFGLAKLSLRLRQYLIILPALQSMLNTIATPSPASAAPAAADVSTDPLSSPPSSSVSSSSYRTHSLHGIRLLSFLSDLSSSGVPVLRRVFRSILNKMDEVLLAQVTGWMFYGAVRDPFGEFFIKQAPEETALQPGGGGGGENGSASASATLSSTSSGAAPLFLRSFSSRGFGSSLRPLPSLDWDASFSLVASQVPLAYLGDMGGMACIHRILFIGKAVLVLQRGEAERERREERSREREARRKRDLASGIGGSGFFSPLGSAQGSSFTPMGFQQQPYSASHGRRSSWGSSGRTPLSRSTAATPRERVSADAGSSSSGGFFRGVPVSSAAQPAVPAAPTVPLLVACQPLLAQFHALSAAAAPPSASSSLDAPPSLHSSLPQLDSLVTQLSALVSQRLYTLLVDTHSLLAHLAHLRRFCLLSSAEFAGALVERVLPIVRSARTGAAAGPNAVVRAERELNARRGALRSALEYAGLNVEQSAEDEEDDLFAADDPSGAAAAEAVANYPARHMMLHLDASPPAASASTAASATSASSASANPFASLRFSYQVGPPLDLILSPEALRMYNNIFRFLLWLHSVRGELTAAWRPLVALQRHSYTPRRSLGMLPALLLRQSMQHVLDTILSYLQVDVVDACWTRMASSLSSTSSAEEGAAAAKEFESVRAAHEEYLRDISSHAFLRDRTVLAALGDVLATCSLFCRSVPFSSSSSPAAAAEDQHANFAKIQRDYARQVSFLFTLLTRKALFTGGRASLLHALVSRLDFNGGLTRMGASLGLDPRSAAAKALVPASHAQGTATSAGDIARSMRGLGGGNPVAPPPASSPAARANGMDALARVMQHHRAGSSSGSSGAGAGTGGASSFAFTPAHLSASSLTSQAHLFAHGSTRSQQQAPPAGAPAYSPRDGTASFTQPAHLQTYQR